MTSNQSSKGEVQLRSSGVFVGTDIGWRRIGDMIRVSAFLEPLDQGEDRSQALTEVTFRHRNGSKRRHVVSAALLTSGSEFVVEMANKGYHWGEKRYRPSVIAALAAQRSHKTKWVVTVPGWHEGAYFFADDWITKEGNKAKGRAISSPGVKWPEITRVGSFRRWKSKVAKLGRYSSRIRLVMAVAFAGSVIRLLNVPSFGIVIVGPSSKGKSFALGLGASVYGMNDPKGLDTIDGTAMDIEQRMLGHRDAFLPLDEIGHLPEEDAAQILKQLAFRSAANKPKGRARQYEIVAGSPGSDWRLTYALTSETSPFEVANRRKGRRIMGEQVRLIEIPAIAEGAIDIFDSSRAGDLVGDTIAQREKKVSELSTIAQENQGHAIIMFLQKFVDDPSATERMRKASMSILADCTDLCTSTERQRIARNLAAAYAAAELAIDYKILPWSKKTTRRDIKKCLKEAFEVMECNSGVKPPSRAACLTDAELIASFIEKLGAASVVDLGRNKSKKRSEIRRADCFRKKFAPPIGRKLLLRVSSFETMFAERDDRQRIIGLLKRRGVLDPGRSPDTSTHQLKVGGVLIAHYRLNEPILKE